MGSQFDKKYISLRLVLCGYLVDNYVKYLVNMMTCDKTILGPQFHGIIKQIAKLKILGTITKFVSIHHNYSCAQNLSHDPLNIPIGL